MPSPARTLSYSTTLTLNRYGNHGQGRPEVWLHHITAWSQDGSFTSAGSNVVSGRSRHSPVWEADIEWWSCASRGQGTALVSGILFR